MGIVQLISLGRPPYPPAPERFHASYLPDPNSGCWLWTGFETPGMGYGRLQVDGKNMYAHRYSWVLHNGPIPHGLKVLHRCDVPACVNPKHLFVGTTLDNALDMWRKGRGHRGGPINAAHGTRMPQSKLNDDAVRKIRVDPRGVTAIARDYGVAHQTIMMLLRGKTWRHVK